MTAVLRPRMAKPAEKLALVVVLPTPPLPEVTTTIRVMVRGFLAEWGQRTGRHQAPTAAMTSLSPSGSVTSRTWPGFPCTVAGKGFSLVR